MTTRYYIEPVSFASGAAARALVASGEALPLGRSDRAFTAARIHRRSGGAVDAVATIACSRISEWVGESGSALDLAVSALQCPPPAFAGMDIRRPAIMGVLNVTPDSFSDGGDFFEASRAVERGAAMMGAGADVVDVGGESTRPGAVPLPAEEELRRVIPVVRGLTDLGTLVSIDTRSARVMREAIDNGARIVNDVSALTSDKGSMGAIAASDVSVILMHMRGQPATMQDAPQYVNVLTDVYDFLDARVAACLEAGIDASRIAVDPGIGFGKTAWHNLRLIEGLGTFLSLGCAVVLGVSRKGFIGRIGDAPNAKDRLPGSLTLALAGMDRGAHVVRVHDVRETRQAVRLWEAVTSVTNSDDHPS